MIAAAPSSASVVPEPQPAAATSAAATSDPFRETIRPILSARCGACHDPGGKMYARLPFDDPQVVSSHSEGVLRRLKDEDREAFQRWLAGLAPAGEQQ
jgi:cytochrome c553